jgi:hypothetical protein
LNHRKEKEGKTRRPRDDENPSRLWDKVVGKSVQKNRGAAGEVEA